MIKMFPGLSGFFWFFFWSTVVSFLDDSVAIKACLVVCKTEECSIIISFWGKSTDGLSL